MATDLQRMYTKARVEGAGHHAALRALADQTGLDKGTIDRCLRRARRADERESRESRS